MASALGFMAIVLAFLGGFFVFDLYRALTMLLESALAWTNAILK